MTLLEPLACIAHSACSELSMMINMTIYLYDMLRCGSSIYIACRLSLRSLVAINNIAVITSHCGVARAVHYWLFTACHGLDSCVLPSGCLYKHLHLRRPLSVHSPYRRSRLRDPARIRSAPSPLCMVCLADGGGTEPPPPRFRPRPRRSVW